MIAYLAKVVLRSFLRLINFDKLSENAGALNCLNNAALPSATEMLSRFVFWVTWLGFILLGVSVPESWACKSRSPDSSSSAATVRCNVHHVLGLLAASFFSRAALLAAVNANVPSPRVLSLAVRSLIVVFVLSIVLEELGLQRRPCWSLSELPSAPSCLD